MNEKIQQETLSPSAGFKQPNITHSVTGDVTPDKCEIKKAY